MSEIPLLKVENLVTGYGNKQIINDISLNVRKGEIVAIIGHNGAGKSTLLKAVFGLIPLWKGTVEFKGENFYARKPHEKVRSGLSFVLQGNRVFSELTVLENLEVGGYLLNGKEELESRLKYVFDFFPRLKERKSQNAGTLSGGEQQMLTLANALMLQPEMLLLDEPSIGLSPKFVNNTFSTIKELNQKSGITILMVEQKVREVLKIAHRVYVVKLGAVAFEGPPQELLEGDRLQEIYLS